MIFLTGYEGRKWICLEKRRLLMNIIIAKRRSQICGAAGWIAGCGASVLYRSVGLSLDCSASVPTSCWCAWKQRTVAPDRGPLLPTWKSWMALLPLGFGTGQPQLLWACGEWTNEMTTFPSLYLWNQINGSIFLKKASLKTYIPY